MLIIINDINSNIGIQSYISLFADNANKLGESNILLELNLGNIYKWLKTTKLDFNPNKC